MNQSYTIASNAVPTRHADAASRRREFRRDVIRGLQKPRKSISCKYLYDERGSALFDEICTLDEYYLTRTEVSILRAHAREMAARIGDDCALIEFGSGSGLKTRLLLEHLSRPRAYLPVDISGEPLERSARELSEQFPHLSIVPVHADFTEPLLLPHAFDSSVRRVVYFPGSTIGNFSPRAACRLLRSIAQLVGPGGGLLIGFDLDKDESIVWPAYNDQRGVSAAFSLNLLGRINRELGADFDLSAFVHRAEYIRARQRVQMHLVSQRPQAVRLSGLTFPFDEGETIHTECSYKYSRQRFGELTSAAGFTLGGEWLDSRAYFAVQYLVVR
jgi:dimethylhistidine N-methyltransferase